MNQNEYRELMTAIAVSAQTTKAYFDSCVRSGFTEAQAMELTKVFVTATINHSGRCDHEQD